MVNLRPSQHQAGPELVTKPNRVQVSRILELPVESVTDEFQPPAISDECRMGLRRLPPIWYNLAKAIGVRSISLKAYAHMVSDPDLQALIEAREELDNISDGTGMVAALMDSMPDFDPSLPVGAIRRRSLYLWSEQLRSAISEVSEQCGVSGKTLLIVYGAVAMLSSLNIPGDTRGTLQQLQQRWHGYLVASRRLSNFRV